MSKKIEITPAVVARLKQNAKKLKKAENITQAKALDITAQKAGYGNWKEITNLPHQQELKLQNSTVIPDKSAAEDLLNKNRMFLSKQGIEYSIFKPTDNTFIKAYVDATRQIRTHFELFDFHDYANQNQGTDYKILKEIDFVSSSKLIATKMSLYRPITKKGDPRMWFTDLKYFADPWDTVAIIICEAKLHLVNLYKEDLEKSFNAKDELGLFLSRSSPSNTISTELLDKLKVLAKKELPAIGSGDTTIGMTLEAALGIPANSSKKPDYKGIELKSGRSKTKNRKTLFAQVADWKISKCKSSAEILDKYGYERDGDFKLYCSVSSQKQNTQGLMFHYDPKTDELNERHEGKKDVAKWTGEVLRKRLQEKHAETFWVTARSIKRDDQEFFSLDSVVHTKSPLLSQLMPLLDSGVITMDHLIKRKSSNNRVSEKGPLFKISDQDLKLLFPEPVEYKLR